MKNLILDKSIECRADQYFTPSLLRELAVKMEEKQIKHFEIDNYTDQSGESNLVLEFYRFETDEEEAARKEREIEWKKQLKAAQLKSLITEIKASGLTLEELGEILK